MEKLLHFVRRWPTKERHLSRVVTGEEAGGLGNSLRGTLGGAVGGEIHRKSGLRHLSFSLLMWHHCGNRGLHAASAVQADLGLVVLRWLELQTFIWALRGTGTPKECPLESGSKPVGVQTHSKASYESFALLCLRHKHVTFHPSDSYPEIRANYSLL